MNLITVLAVVLLPGHVPAIMNEAVQETRAQCEAKFERRLAGNSNGRRSTNTASSSRGYRDLVDLGGFAVHQPLQSAPFDVYVTEMRIRVPEHSQWFQLEDCSFEPGRRALSARMGLKNMLVSGRIKLTQGGRQSGLGALGTSGFTYGRINRGFISDASCSMTLRLRRAELGVHATESGLALPSVLPVPTASPLIRTDAHFVEPELASMTVHAYGCSMDDPGEPMAQEVEDVFMRGMQTVVARAIQRRLQPALRDALLLHLGYSPSYGKR